MNTYFLRECFKTARQNLCKLYKPFEEIERFKQWNLDVEAEKEPFPAWFKSDPAPVSVVAKPIIQAINPVPAVPVPIGVILPIPGCTMTNENGLVSLFFSQIPVEKVRKALKKQGFRWVKQFKSWIASNNPLTLGLADCLVTHNPF
jgi:hypothetical protein